MLSLAWVGLLSGGFLAHCAVVRSSCRVWPSGPVVWFRPPGLFLPFSEKRRRPRAPTQGPVFQQVPPLRTRYLWPMYFCRGICRFYSSFPIVLSFFISPLETLRRAGCRLSAHAEGCSLIAEREKKFDVKLSSHTFLSRYTAHRALWIQTLIST